MDRPGKLKWMSPPQARPERHMTAVTAYFGVTGRNFWMTEPRMAQLGLIDEMGTAPGLSLEDGLLTPPSRPGFGIELNEDALDYRRVRDEPFLD